MPFIILETDSFLLRNRLLLFRHQIADEVDGLLPLHVDTDVGCTIIVHIDMEGVIVFTGTGRELNLVIALLAQLLFIIQYLGFKVQSLASPVRDGVGTSILRQI